MTDSTIVKNALRLLGTPSGGKMILSKVAFTSALVIGVPSWNLTSLRSLKVNFVPPSVGAGTSPSQVSHTKSVGDDGLSGLTLMSRL